MGAADNQSIALAEPVFQRGAGATAVFFGFALTFAESSPPASVRQRISVFRIFSGAVIGFLSRTHQYPPAGAALADRRMEADDGCMTDKCYLSRACTSAIVRASSGAI